MYSFLLSVCLFICSIVRSLLSITLVEFTSKFSVKVSLSGYLSSHSSESIHIWTMGPLEGLLPCHEYDDLGVGLEVKMWDTF